MTAASSGMPICRAWILYPSNQAALALLDRFHGKSGVDVATCAAASTDVVLPFRPPRDGQEHLVAVRARARVRREPAGSDAAAGGFDQPLPTDWDGVLMEHFVLHELQCYLHYAGVRGTFGYWATPSGSKEDFVWWRGSDVVAIDVKHGHGYRREYRQGLEAFLGARRARSFIVYQGTQELGIEGTRVLPLERFLRQLHAGEIVG